MHKYVIFLDCVTEFRNAKNKFWQAIPASFLYNHPMHTYRKVLLIHQNIEYEMTVNMDYHSENPTRKNHVNILGRWMEFAEDCDFGLRKMLRFKWYDLLPGDNGDEDSVPVFHVC